jgi:hypothetical protein
MQVFRQHNVSNVVRVCDSTYNTDTLKNSGIAVWPLRQIVSSIWHLAFDRDHGKDVVFALKLADWMTTGQCCGRPAWARQE